MCLLWKKCLFRFCAHFFGLDFFSDTELCELFVYFWRLIPCHCFICKYFLPFWGLSFHLVMVSFAVQKLLHFIRSCLFIFVFIFITLWGGSKKIFLQFMSKSTLPMLSYKSFVVLGLTFRFLIHLEFIVVYAINVYPNSFFYI